MFSNPNVFQDPCESAVHSVIHLIQTHQWMRDFLFPTQEDDFSQLSHAVVHPCIALGEMSLRILPNPETHFEPCNEVIQVVFAPLFSVDRFVAGFQILHRLRTSSCLLKEAPRYVGRSIRDSRTASFFSLKEHPFGMTELKIMQQLSPGCRQQAVVMLDSKHFRRIIDLPLGDSHLKSPANTLNGYNYNPTAITSLTPTYSANPKGALTSALIHTFYIVELRKCPQCNADTFLLCSCTSESATISSSLNPKLSSFNSLIASWSEFEGTYEGEMSYRIYQQGFVLQASECQAVIMAQHLNNRLLTEELTRWAMSEASSKMHLNIMKLCMPKSTTTDEDTQTEMETEAMIMEFRRMHVADTMRTWAQYYGVTTRAYISNRDHCPKLLAPAPEGYKRTVMVKKPKRSAESLSKEAARKIRNRESAQRCNERRSKQLKELKNGIREMEEKEKCLRSKLERLKSENREMKQKLVEKWASETAGVK